MPFPFLLPLPLPFLTLNNQSNVLLRLVLPLHPLPLYHQFPSSYYPIFISFTAPRLHPLNASTSPHFPHKYLPFLIPFLLPFSLHYYLLFTSSSSFVFPYLLLLSLPLHQKNFLPLPSSSFSSSTSHFINDQRFTSFSPFFYYPSSFISLLTLSTILPSYFIF